MRRSESYTDDATQSERSSDESDNSYQSSTRSKTRMFVSIDNESKPFRSRSYKAAEKRCESRNAVMARKNREKKKEYLTKLQGDHRDLRERHEGTLKALGAQASLVDRLRTRVRYLESVLANSKEIGQLVRAVNLATGLPTTNSLKSG